MERGDHIRGIVMSAKSVKIRTGCDCCNESSCVIKLALHGLKGDRIEGRADVTNEVLGHHCHSKRRKKEKSFYWIRVNAKSFFSLSP